MEWKQSANLVPALQGLDSIQPPMEVTKMSSTLMRAVVVLISAHCCPYAAMLQMVQLLGNMLTSGRLLFPHPQQTQL